MAARSTVSAARSQTLYRRSQLARQKSAVDSLGKATAGKWQDEGSHDRETRRWPLATDRLGRAAQSVRQLVAEALEVMSSEPWAPQPDGVDPKILRLETSARARCWVELGWAPQSSPNMIRLALTNPRQCLSRADTLNRPSLHGSRIRDQRNHVQGMSETLFGALRPGTGCWDSPAASICLCHFDATGRNGCVMGARIDRLGERWQGGQTLIGAARSSWHRKPRPRQCRSPD